MWKPYKEFFLQDSFFGGQFSGSNLGGLSTSQKNVRRRPFASFKKETRFSASWLPEKKYVARLGTLTYATYLYHPAFAFIYIYIYVHRSVYIINMYMDFISGRISHIIPSMICYYNTLFRHQRKHIHCVNSFLSPVLCHLQAVLSHLYSGGV